MGQTPGASTPWFPLTASPQAPSAQGHAEQMQKQGKKMGFSLSQDTFLLGKHWD